MSKANERQVGGDHYRSASGHLQHWDYVVRALRNRYLEGQATKYMIRPGKGDELKDAEKCIHYIDKLIEEHTAGRIAPIFTGHLDFEFNVTAWAGTVGFNPNSIQVHFLRSIATWTDLHDLEVLRRLATVHRDHLHAQEPSPGYTDQD